MQNSRQQAVLTVAGMKNNACRERVIQALEAVDGVQDVSVSLIRGRGIVLFVPPCEAQQLIQAVVFAGYGASLTSSTQR